jgi:hypothetical protein
MARWQSDIKQSGYYMSVISQEQFETLLPLVCAWAEEQERIILRDGVPLTVVQVIDANRAGVSHPERVRLLSVSNIPIPEHPALRAAAEDTQLITPCTAGLTLRYGIFIRSNCWNNRQIVVHELVHTSQYERLGGFQAFLQQYLYECITIGYPQAPMEQEAITTAERLCN